MKLPLTHPPRVMRQGAENQGISHRPVWRKARFSQPRSSNPSTAGLAATQAGNGGKFSEEIEIP